ncbi:MAG: hypothetical protein HYT50_00380 [Candidatus Wildermuthbacteria bacterium]|nr:hypothetical protein [Candidatus Wildermuthbacteria bacterium]
MTMNGQGSPGPAVNFARYPRLRVQVASSKIILPNPGAKGRIYQPTTSTLALVESWLDADLEHFPGKPLPFVVLAQRLFPLLDRIIVKAEFAFRGSGIRDTDRLNGKQFTLVLFIPDPRNIPPPYIS